MSRALTWMTALCAISLLANAWLYRELKLAERRSEASSVLIPAQPTAAIFEAKSTPVQSMDPDARVPKKAEPKLTPKEMMEKCRQKFQADWQQRLRDPVQREAFKKSEVTMLQAMNVGAQAQLQLSDQAFSRLTDLQAEQDLAEREASIGKGNLANGPSSSVNPQIAQEFGNDIATKWASYQREYRARAQIHGVANLLADANMSLTEVQKRKLTEVYAQEYEAEGGQIRLGWPPDLGSPSENLDVGKQFQKELSRQQAFDQQTQVEAATFLTPAQLEPLRKKSDRDAEQLRSIMLSMPKEVPAATFEGTLADC